MHALSTLLPLAALAAAGPTKIPRAVTSLNEEATAEAHVRDDTATRAFSNVQIRTSTGQCLFVDKLSGDFRANLTPVQVAECGATEGQGWDVITAGKHITAQGAMLIVSTTTQACFNFDPRRAAGNQVNLFSCGGRADGGGAATNSQAFTFPGDTSPFSFQPRNENGKCLVVKGTNIDVANCAAGDAAQSFTFGDGDVGAPANTTSAADQGAATTEAPAPSSSSSCAGFKRTKTVIVDLEARSLPGIALPGADEPTAVAIGAQEADEPTATPEAGAKDENARKGGNKGKQNQAPTSAAAAQPAETTAAAAPEPQKPGKGGNGAGGQGKGKQNQAPTTTTSAAAAETSAAGNADGGEQDDAEEAEGAQSSASSGAAAPSSTAATPIQGGNKGKGKGKGKGNGQQTQTASNEPGATASASSSSSASPSAAEVTDLPTANSTASASASSSGAASSSASSSGAQATAKPTGAIPNPTTAVPVSRAGGTLDPSAAAAAHQRDETATRAFTGVEIRAPNGQCMFVDPTAGDFRQNLIPVQLVDCSGSENEKWDIITSGKHNVNQPGQNRILVVSSVMNGCLNFDGRRPAGDQVIIFSCGGRADGEGETTGSQQFEFIGAKSFAWAPVSEGGRTCILPGESEGRLVGGACPQGAAGSGLFSVFP